MDKKLIFNGLEANCFHNHFALTITQTCRNYQYATFSKNNPDGGAVYFDGSFVNVSI